MGDNLTTSNGISNKALLQAGGLVLFAVLSAVLYNMWFEIRDTQRELNAFRSNAYKEFATKQEFTDMKTKIDAIYETVIELKTIQDQTQKEEQ